MLSALILTSGILFYSVISWPSLLIADMASTDISLGVLGCEVTAVDTVQQ